jgi:glycosyltransferase involved in cell wall biosynthesis
MAGGSGGGRGRLVFDITTTAVWSGPPVGIVRVESEFARWALTHLDDVVPAFFDPDMRCFRGVGPAMARSLIDQDTAFDGLSFVNPARMGRRKTDRIPAALQPYAKWVLQFRRTLLQTLERVRLTTPSRRTAAFADRVQRAIMSKKYRAIMVKPDGTRRANLSKEMAFGPPVNLTAHDTLVCAGGGWLHNDIAAIAALKREVGFRFVLMCYDIIPELFPHFLKAADVKVHRDYLHRAFQAADLVIFISRTVEADVKAYCKAQALTLGATAVCLLGADMSAPNATAPLPAELERERYAVLVSTIEPRKGHRLIYDAWLKLLEAGIPQRARFKLVFVGREGWMVDELMRDLRNDPRIAGTLVMLHDASDATVAALYRDAAFCLCPSRYEGYGLPLVEAFRHGKAVLASTGGAVPEVVGGFSPCLDPTDGKAWQRMLETWIEDPAARAVYETRIRSSFRHPDWDESARNFFALARGEERSIGNAPSISL